MDEQEFIKLFDENHVFSDSELGDIVYKYGEILSYDEPLRWVTPVTSLIEIDDRKFLIYWYQGNTEYQDNEFQNQPEEVTRETTQVTCDANVYKDKKGNIVYIDYLN